MSFLKRIENFPLLGTLISISKRVSFPGFRGVPIYNVLSFIYREIIKDDIITRANSIAYSLFLSLFPSLIFLFTILPLIPSTQDLLPMIDKSLDQFLPKQAHEYLFDIIYNILAIKRQGLLSVGFLLALYFGSSGMKTLMKGFDKAYDSTFRTRSWLNFELTAVALTIVLALMLIISVVLIVLGKQVLGAAFNFLELSEYASQVIKYASYIVVGFLFYLMISIIYKYGPSMKKRTSIFNPGAYLATLVMFLISVLFSYFVDNFGKYNELYGSIGALIVLMIWLQINAVILLIGFELNTSIAVNKDLSVLPENQEENPKEKP